MEKILGDPASACPYPNTICFFDNGSHLYLIANREVVDAPRNTCFCCINGTGFVYNNTNYRWFLFRTSNCTGSHMEVAPHGIFNGVGIGWEDMHSYYRTSSTS